MEYINLNLTKNIKIPDKLKLERYKKSPELGPAVLFFSGGSALKDLSKELITYTHNSIHIITPFDSGGSSAELRKAFDMPAVGDIRNRLMALADQSIKGNPEIYQLFTHRLPQKADQSILYARLQEMAQGKHQLTASIPEPMRTIIQNHLKYFIRHKPDNFDLQGASLGNLILSAGYLEQGKLLDPVIYIYSKLAEVRGIVRSVLNSNLHLAVELENGSMLLGQHRFTSKEKPAITSRITNIYLSSSLQRFVPAEASIRSNIQSLIKKADLICYSMGSFFSSIIANLLPLGVGRAVAQAKCPKVFIPNTAFDPECFELNLQDQTNLLLYYLQADNPGKIKAQDVLDFIILDNYMHRHDSQQLQQKMQQYGLKCLSFDLVGPEAMPYINPERLIQILLSLT